MKNLKTFFLLIIAFVSHTTAIGQYFKNYNTGNGLISNYAYHVMCDSKGYIWLCTNKGVVRFDGQNFKSYTVANGLRDNEIYNCYEDLYSRVWFYTFNGQFCYYKNDTIYNSNNNPFLEKLNIYSYINTMYENYTDSTLYIGHSYGPIQIIKKNTIKTINTPLSKHSKIRTISASNKGLHVTSLIDDLLLRNDSVIKKTTHNIKNTFYSNEHLIITDSKGISIYTKDSLVWNVTDPDVVFGSTLHLFYDGNGYIFCGTTRGLIVYNIYTNRKLHFYQNSKVSSSSTDADGNYWISTLGHGVYYFSKANLNSLLILENVNGYDLIESTSGQIFLKKKDTIQILKTNSLSLSLKKINGHIPDHAEPIFYNDNYLYYHELTAGGKSYSVNINTGERKRIYDQFFKAFEVSKNNYVLFSSNHLFRGITLNGDIKKKSYFNFDQRLSSQTYIKDLNSVFFILGKNILCEYNCTNDQVIPIDTLKDLASSNCIFYNNELLYICGNNGYTYIYNVASGKIQRSIKLGIGIYNIINIGNNSFLANTDRGYRLVDIVNDSLLFKNIQYPISQNDIVFISFSNDKMICRTGDYIYSFPPNSLKQQSIKPKLYINSITLNNRKKQGDIVNIEAVDKANLNILLNTVYFGGNKLAYRYRTIKNNTKTEEWHLTQAEQLNFLFNSSGKYKIEIQVAEVDGIFSESKMVYLQIIPSFIRSYYFILMCTILILVIMLLIMRWVHIKRKIAFANEMNFMKLEHRAASALLNPHFIFNAINNIQNLINQNSKILAREYLATLSVMIRQNIDNLQFHLIPLINEIDLIKNYVELQNLRFEHKIHYYLNNKVTQECYIPPLLIQTFVENAIIHGYDKQQENFSITISILSTVDDYLVIKISDNGRGINNTNRNGGNNKTSIGISFTEKRLKRLSEFCKKEYTLLVSDISEISSRETGTEVTIIIYAQMMNLMYNDK